MADLPEFKTWTESGTEPYRQHIGKVLAYGERDAGDPRRGVNWLISPEIVRYAWSTDSAGAIPAKQVGVVVCHHCQATMRLGPFCNHWRQAIQQQREPMPWDYLNTAQLKERRNTLGEQPLVSYISVPLVKGETVVVQLSQGPSHVEVLMRVKNPNSDAASADKGVWQHVGWISYAEGRWVIRGLLLEFVLLHDWATQPCNERWCAGEPKYIDQAHRVRDCLSRMYFNQCERCEETHDEMIPDVPAPRRLKRKSAPRNPFE